MRIPSYYLLITCLLFVCSVCYAEVNPSESESILPLVQKLDKDERSQFFEELIKAKGISAMDQLEREAHEASNHIWVAYAYYRRMVENKLSNEGNTSTYHDQAQIGMDELDLFIEMKNHFPDKVTKADMELYQFLRLRFVEARVEYYFSENKFDLASVYIKNMLNKEEYGEYDSFESGAYFLLGFSYLSARRGEEALESFRKAYEIYQRTSFKKKSYEYFRLFNGMSHAYMAMKDYEGMIMINDSVQTLIDEEHAKTGDEGSFYQLAKFIINYEKAYGYLFTNKLSEARQKLDLAKDLISKGLVEGQFVCVYYQVEAQYYSVMGKHDLAKKYLDDSESCFKARSVKLSALNYLKINLIRAEVLHHSGDNKEAYILLNELFQLNDSINASTISKQLSEIQTAYMVDTIKLESERDKAKLYITQLVLFISILISLLLIYIVYISRKNSKALQEKNKQLFSQYSKLESNRVMIRELESSQFLEPNNVEEEENPQVLIMKKLEEHLTSTKAYTNPDISREDLALVVGTNRQYLIEAIKAQTGKTFNEYIYNHRIKYAYSLIVNNEFNNISDISSESGFVTRGTFNRVFKETFGMNPSELKELVNNMSKK